MSNLAIPHSQMELRETQSAARRLDLRLHSVPISANTSIENAFEKIKKEPQALIVVTDAILYSQRRQISDFAAGNRLPAMYPYRDFPEAGGLMRPSEFARLQYARASHAPLSTRAFAWRNPFLRHIISPSVGLG